MAGKQLSRLTSQDRVLTANDLFDPNERPHGAVMALRETKNLVDHSTQAHIFATKAELDTFVAEQSALSEGERTVKVGDNLYITDTGVPDYWWMGKAPWISVLESGAVNVTVDDALSTISNNPVQNKVITEALNDKPSYSYISNSIKWDDSPFVTCTFGDELREPDKAALISSSPDINGKFHGIAFKDGEIKWVDNSGNVHTETLGGGGGGGFDPDVSAVAIGLDAVACGGRAIAIGESAFSTGGVAIGHKAGSPADSVSIGGPITGCAAGGARSTACSVVIGAGACGQCWSVVAGYNASADSYGTAAGNGAKASGDAVAVGASTCAGPQSVTIGRNAIADNGSVAIGQGAGGGCTGVATVVIGPYTTNSMTPDGSYCFYPIVIGTSCYAMGDPLVNATIRVDAEGNLTVGGKPVGGGGDSAVEVWKGNVGFGEQDTFIGAKKTADGDGQFQNGYPRLHNHGQDIHEVSGFSRDSYENEDVWSHRFIIPWDLAKANDTSYMAANVKWQGNRNLLQTGDETTFVQPLMPANTGNTSSVFPYAIPAFEESPVYWSGTVIYNDTMNTCGSYTDTAKIVSVPWEAMCSSETTEGGYSFLLYRKRTQAICQLSDGVTVAVSYSGGGGGEIVLASQYYVNTLSERITALETKLAAVGA